MKEQGTVVRCTSPVHIHVDDTTPVHVHVKKAKKTDSRPVAAGRSSHESICSSFLQQNNDMPLQKSRSKSPVVRCPVPASSNAIFAGPWVPPPARTTRGQKYPFQGSPYRVDGPQSGSNLRDFSGACEEIDSEEEDRLHGRVRQYEKRIETLMEQVAELKKELDKSKKESSACKEPDSGQQMPKYDRLMKHFDEVDAGADAVSKQICALSCALQQLQKDERRGCDTAANSRVLANHRQILLDRLAGMDTVCRRVKRLMCENREELTNQQNVVQQRDCLLDQVEKLELAHKARKRELNDKETQIVELRALCDLQTDEALGATELHGSLETSKAQLQKLLRQRDLDCNKMQLEIQNLQTQLTRERCEVENLQTILAEVHRKTKEEKTAKRKTAARDGDYNRESSQQALDRDSVIDLLQTELNSLREYCDKMNRERSKTTADTSAHQLQIQELEVVIERMSNDAKRDLAAAEARFQEKAAEASALCQQNERMQSTMASLECRLEQATSDMAELRAKGCEYERMVEDYRCQISRSRRDADEALARLDENRREMNCFRQESELEMERLKHQLQSRLKELEPLPEQLRASEQRLQQVCDQLEQYKHIHERDVRLISDLNTKVEQQTQFELEKRDLLRRVSDREESVHQANLQIQELMKDNTAMKYRMEAMQADIERKEEQNRDRVSVQERAQRAHLLDLETQLNQSRAEVLRLRHDKEEAERRCNSQLYDMRDRLEQSHSTNRSLQNYIEFLKNSYTSCFADAITATPGPGGSSISSHRTTPGTVPRATFS